MVLMLALGGGASVAAEGSVPGDVLYPVKIRVNEQVRGVLATSAEADAEWEAELASRRLEEVQKLKSRGTVEADIATELGAEFSEHADAAMKAMESLEAAGHADIAARIQAHLSEIADMHAEIFAENNSQASEHARAFVIPHVLEKSSVSAREQGTGKATGKASLDTADVDLDGSTDITVTGNLQVDGGTMKGEGSVTGKSEVRESPSKASTGASIEVEL